MTEAAFAKDDRVLCLWFSGWTFEGFENAKTVVIEQEAKPGPDPRAALPKRRGPGLQ